MKIYFFVLGCFFGVLYFFTPLIYDVMGVKKATENYFIAGSLLYVITFGGTAVIQELGKILSVLKEIKGEKEEVKNKGQGG